MYRVKIVILLKIHSCDFIRMAKSMYPVEHVMAIIVTNSLPSMTKETYEQMRKELNWEGNPPAGMMGHIAGIEGSGMRVVTLWSSESDFNNFVTSRLAPAFEKRNLPKPQPQVLQIHNMNVFPALEKYRIAAQTH